MSSISMIFRLLFVLNSSSENCVGGIEIEGFSTVAELKLERCCLSLVIRLLDLDLMG